MSLRTISYETICLRAATCLRTACKRPHMCRYDAADDDVGM